MDTKIRSWVKVPTVYPCRPCSVYGTATCWRGDFACMKRIGVGEVVERVLVAAKAQKRKTE